MSRTVRPIKVKRVPLEDVPVGDTFALGGVRYLKLSDYDSEVYENMSCVGVTATTILPLCEFDSVYQGESKKSIEERAVCMFMAATADHDNHIITYGMPDTDDYRKYAQIIAPYIKGVWYVDNGFEAVHGDEYFYVDEFCNLQKGNEYDERADGVSRRIGVRAFYAIDPNALVTVR